MKAILAWLYILFWVLYAWGYVLCIMKFIESDFKPSYKRECIYGGSLVLGIGGFVGYLDIPDNIE